MRREIEEILLDIEYASVKEALKNYEREGRPFALPKFKQQDRTSVKQRTGDLLGGFPFTSDAFPWPRGGPEDLHMQPLIQINLDKVSKLLDFDFGRGLLQLWGIVGGHRESFNAIEMAFDSDFNKGVLARIIPSDQTLGVPDEFFPEFAPWLICKEDVHDRVGQLFIEPSREMSIGSLITWKPSNEFMYPMPLYEMHDVNSLALTIVKDDVDSYELFEELKAAVSVGLKTPSDCGNCYLGGVRGYGDGRYADPAQGFPVLINISGEINLSVIFDESVHVKPEIEGGEAIEYIYFPREKKLRVVYCYNE